MLARVSHCRYGPCAAMYLSALRPCQAADRTEPSTLISSAAAAEYSALSADQAPAAASRAAGPSPPLNSAECNSGGEAIQPPFTPDTNFYERN